MASYFWVGGAGTLDNASTTHIAAASGGAAGAGPVTSADSITFDSNSGFSSSSKALTIAAGFSCAAFTLTGPSNKLMAVTQNGAMTVSGAFSAQGASVVNRVGWSSATAGTPATVTVGALGTVANIDFEDITAAGAGAPIAGASIGDAGGNTNITTTASRTVYAVGSTSLNFSSTAMWANASGGASGAAVPLPQDSVIFDANSSGSYTCDMPRPCKNLTCTSSFTKSITLNVSGGPTFYGSITLTAGMTWTGSALTLGARSPQTITSAGHTLSAGSGITIAAPGGTYTLQDALVAPAINHTQLGTFSDGGHSVTLTGAGYSNNIGGVGNTLTASGTWTLSGTGTIWSVSNTSATITFTGTIVISDTSATGKTFLNNSTISLSAATLWITGGGTGPVTFSHGMPTLNRLTIGAPKTVTLLSTMTLTTAYLLARGSAGNIITINATIAGSAATLRTTGGVQGGDYLSLRDVAFTQPGGSNFYAGSHSTIVSNVTGTGIADPSVLTGDTAGASDTTGRIIGGVRSKGEGAFTADLVTYTAAQHVRTAISETARAADTVVRSVHQLRTTRSSGRLAGRLFQLGSIWNPPGELQLGVTYGYEHSPTFVFQLGSIYDQLGRLQLGVIDARAPDDARADETPTGIIHHLPRGLNDAAAAGDRTASPAGGVRRAADEADETDGLQTLRSTSRLLGDAAATGDLAAVLAAAARALADTSATSDVGSRQASEIRRLAAQHITTGDVVTFTGTTYSTRFLSDLAQSDETATDIITLFVHAADLSAAGDSAPTAAAARRALADLLAMADEATFHQHLVDHATDLSVLSDRVVRAAASQARLTVGDATALVEALATIMQWPRPPHGRPDPGRIAGGDTGRPAATVAGPVSL